MRVGGLYRVTGARNFRGHLPGTEFAAFLDPNQEARAIRRGDITRVRQIRPSLQPGSLTLPRDWLTQHHKEADNG